MTTSWTADDLVRRGAAARTTAPLIDHAGCARVLSGEDLWDPWPLQEEDGTPSSILGGELWMALTAPADGHPELRHDVARLRLFSVTADGWRDLGPVFADGASPGSREWSGSAIRRADGTVSVFYTAAGERGESPVTFRQRAMEVRMALDVDGDAVRLRPLGPHREIVRPDGRTYLHADDRVGGPGKIRAFRDPAWFRDPATGRAHLVIAASVAGARRFTGAVALADERDGGWELRAPLLTADGVNHEIERPHVIVRDGRYHLFLSTHGQSFDVADAPTGLYGFVAEALTGPYRPLNGSGLVVANPPAAPDQAYAWLVLPDLRVVSFLNYAADGRHLEGAAARAAFGGTVAPVLRLAIDGDRTAIVGDA